MPNILEDVGPGYFNERFYGSYFLTEDQLPAIVRRATDGGEVAATVVGGTLGRIRVEERMIPPAFFTDMSVFATPPLGWRSAANGRVLVNITRTQSYHRGLSSHNVNVRYHEMTNELFYAGEMSEDYYSRDTCRAKIIMQPEYIPFVQGVRQMLEGELLSFCVSERIAVVPGPDGTLDVLCGWKRVGSVNENGELTCSIPIIEQVLEVAA